MAPYIRIAIDGPPWVPSLPKLRLKVPPIIRIIPKIPQKGLIPQSKAKEIPKIELWLRASLKKVIPRHITKHPKGAKKVERIPPTRMDFKSKSLMVMITFPVITTTVMGMIVMMNIRSKGHFMGHHSGE